MSKLNIRLTPKSFLTFASKTNVAQFLNEVIQLLIRILEAPLAYLFGRDIFISYSRQDSANYAQQLAIDLREQSPKLSFYLDQWASLSGTTLPSSLKRALRWSRLLVFIGTQNAITSPSVRLELEVFFRKKGRFVPIDVDGVLGQAILKDHFLAEICGPGSVKEIGVHITDGQPSTAVVTRVTNALKFTRQDQRLRRAVVRTTIGVIVIIAGAYFASQYIVAKAQSEAAQQIAFANDQQMKAVNNAVQATVAAGTAKSDEMLARLRAKQANEEAALANTARLDAERLRDQARSEAAMQGEIAVFRQRANQAEVSLRRSPDLVTKSTSLAVEAMSRADALGIHSLEADTALRSTLSLLPRSLNSRAVEGNTTSIALSPDGKYLAAYDVKTSSKESDSVLRIQRVADGQEIATRPYQGFLVALSNDASRISISDGHTVHSSDLSGSAKWEFTIEDKLDRIIGMAISPDGKYLALGINNANRESTVVVVRELESGKRVAQLTPEGYIYAASIAFSANGSSLAIGGMGYGQKGKWTGRALVWEITSPSQPGTLTEKNFGQPAQFLQNGGIGTIAPGTDSRYLATSGYKTAIVWKKTNENSYREIARMPADQPINDLAFSTDGRNLTVLSGGPCGKWHSGCPSGKITVKTWDSIGYSEHSPRHTQSRFRRWRFDLTISLLRL